MVRLGKALGEEGFAPHYCKLLAAGAEQRIVAPILCNIKDHKIKWEVVPRILHSGSGSPFAGISMFLAAMIRKKVNNLPHVFGSTCALLNAVRKRRYSSGCKLAEFDIKDFYHMGTAETHIESSFVHVADTALRQCLEDRTRQIAAHAKPSIKDLPASQS